MVNQNSQGKLDSVFWDSRWKEGRTGWDLGQASPALTAYFDQRTDKHVSILIPGCGSAYEASYLVNNGFTDITLLEISKEAAIRLRKKFEFLPQVKVLEQDFFDHEGQYDLIVEQTFFCALDPLLRPRYVSHARDLLNAGGKLMGLLFDREFDEPGPPFGGAAEDYQKLFSPHFKIKTMERCYNSIPPRQGHEVFVLLTK
ncbi:MAG TPA: methyltransferase [Saprospiraceae bacterium]|nr:methyltransferase [Saprospiraceae bacterium]